MQETEHTKNEAVLAVLSVLPQEAGCVVDGNSHVPVGLFYQHAKEGRWSALSPVVALLQARDFAWSVDQRGSFGECTLHVHKNNDPHTRWLINEQASSAFWAFLLCVAHAAKQGAFE